MLSITDWAFSWPISIEREVSDGLIHVCFLKENKCFVLWGEEVLEIWHKIDREGQLGGS